MVERVATPDTHIMGETFVPIDTDNDGTPDAFSTRVSNPHLWAASLVYLTAMALYNPELFDPHVAVLEPFKEPDSSKSGCGCGTNRPAPGGAGLMWWLVMVWLGLSCRRQRVRLPAKTAGIA